MRGSVYTATPDLGQVINTTDMLMNVTCVNTTQNDWPIETLQVSRKPATDHEAFTTSAKLISRCIWKCTIKPHRQVHWHWNRTLYQPFDSDTHVYAEGQQHTGILRVVCDLGQWCEGQVFVGKTFSKVIRDKDSRIFLSRHLAGQDHLYEAMWRNQTDEATNWNIIFVHLYEKSPNNNVGSVLPENLTHFARVLRADANSKLCPDEGVVNQFGDILERLPIVLTGRQRVQWQGNERQIPCKLKKKNICFIYSPSVEFGLTEFHHEEGHLEGSQCQDDLPRKKSHCMCDTLGDVQCDVTSAQTRDKEQFLLKSSSLADGSVQLYLLMAERNNTYPSAISNPGQGHWTTQVIEGIL